MQHNDMAWLKCFDVTDEFGNPAQLPDRSPQSGISLYTRHIFDHGKSPVFFNNRGYYYYSGGHYIMAYDDFTYGIEINPDCAILYYNRAFCSYKLGKINAAVADCTEAIRLNPEDALAYNNRAFCNRSLGNLSAALTDYTKSINIHPGNAIVYVNRAQLYSDYLFKHDLALLDYNNALSLNPSFTTASINLHFLKNTIELRSAILDCYSQPSESKPAADAVLADKLAPCFKHSIYSVIIALSTHHIIIKLINDALHHRTILGGSLVGFNSILEKLEQFGKRLDDEQREVARISILIGKNRSAFFNIPDEVGVLIATKATAILPESIARRVAYQHYGSPEN